MTLQTIKFEYDIPDGYRFVKFGTPNNGDLYLTSEGKVTKALWNYTEDWIIVEKIPPQPQQPKRKHADLIHAWADGAEIQYKCGDDWNDIANPNFLYDIKYRIKPKPKTVRFRNYMDNENEVHVYHEGEDLYHFKKWLGDWQEVEIEE